VFFRIKGTDRCASLKIKASCKIEESLVLSSIKIVSKIPLERPG